MIRMKKFLKVNGEYKEVSNEKIEELVKYYNEKDDCRPLVLEKMEGENLYFSVEYYEC